MKRCLFFFLALIAVLVLAVLQGAGTDGREMVLASNETKVNQAADKTGLNQDVPTAAKLDSNLNIQDP